MEKEFAQIFDRVNKEDSADLTIRLAALLLKNAEKERTFSEKRRQKLFAKMVNDPKGKAFTVLVADQSFRSSCPPRAADQIRYLIHRFGIPSYFNPLQKLSLFAFKHLSYLAPRFFMSLFKKVLRNETKDVIIPKNRLKKHIALRTSQGITVNVNHLGEAILGEQEAERRLQIYLDDLSKPEITYISVKISSIFSQINLIAYEDTVNHLAERLKRLYRTGKFINLDMEEYKDLHLTVDVFKKVLELDEFLGVSAGIVLQAYIPDSIAIQKELTEWAKARVARGGAPIKIRLVKGANLAAEMVESSLQGWPLATYSQKSDADAAFKKMLQYGLERDNAHAVNIGIASHNIFDIAYGMILRAKNGVQEHVEFEMLEGMANPLMRTVLKLTGSMVLYSPTYHESDFIPAVAYLVRRLDENTGPENFLRSSFAMNQESFDLEKERFKESLRDVSTTSHREQIRKIPLKDSLFVNEPSTDWSLKKKHEWKETPYESIPLVIAGKERFKEKKGIGIDPSFRDKAIYDYALADLADVNDALSCTPEPCADHLYETANEFRKARNDLIALMMQDAGKTPYEADVEVSEAIDFIEYYRRMQSAINGTPKGIVLITPPWNFPCAIPVGGIAAALAAGNQVIFKPAPETVQVGWHVASLFWKAGFDKKRLQFIVAEDDVGSLLVQDPRVNLVVLTGSTETAKLFMKLRPGRDLIAETGGKNSMIVTALADRDLAIKDIVNSAFGHAGQKCSACSLLILEKEVYDNPEFMRQLKDAASSLSVGPIWDLKNKIGPLIREPTDAMTALEEGEEWLLKPTRNPENPRILTPGIKIGVKQGSFTYNTELFGPILAVMRAENLEEALVIANGTRYGLTAGLHSLDAREKAFWKERMIAGNLYINRGITGAIVLRQPFGGCKESSFGGGHKAGGPNYLFGFQNVEDNYAGNYFEKAHDPVNLLGQDNILTYVPKTAFTGQNGRVEQLKYLREVALCEDYHRYGNLSERENL